MSRPTSAESRTVWLSAAGVLLLAGIAYAPSLRFDYVQDAHHAIRVNPVVERGDPVEIFTSDYWKDTVSPARTLYRPVTVLSFALERRVGGGPNAALSHLLNVALHAITALLLLVLLLRYGAGPTGAGAAALLFAAHPLLLQAVVNLVARADLLAALFGLAALLCWTGTTEGSQGRRRSPLRQRLAALGAGACVFAALGSKEIAVAVLALLVTAELLAVRHHARRARSGRWVGRAAAFAPTVLAGLIWLHLRTLAIGEFPGLQPLAAEDNVLVGSTGTVRVATTLALAARYVGLLIWPVGLAPDYSGSVIARESSLFAPLPLLGLVWLGALLALLLRPLWARRGSGSGRRVAALGAALYLLPYLVVGNVLVLNAAGFAERLLYFSATGFCALVGVALEALAGARRGMRAIVAAALALVLVLGVVQIRRQSPMWKDEPGFWDHALRAAPRSLRANLVHAGRLESEGRADEALEVWERVVRETPDYGGGWMARGVLLARRGELAEAERSLRRSIALRPEIGETRLHLGLLLLRTGRVEEAERELRRALLLSPQLVEAAAQLGHLLYRAGRFEEAAHFYRGCVRLGRQDLQDELRAAEAHAARLGSR